MAGEGLKGLLGLAAAMLGRVVFGVLGPGRGCLTGLAGLLELLAAKLVEGTVLARIGEAGLLGSEVPEITVAALTGEAGRDSGLSEDAGFCADLAKTPDGLCEVETPRPTAAVGTEAETKDLSRDLAFAKGA